MKISEKQKTANRKRIIDTAVELMAIDGVEAVSMRRIAKEAGIGEATIYNYFSTREQLISGYYHDRGERVIEALRQIEGWERFTFGEQFQSVIDAWLAEFVKDRTFVTATFTHTFMRPAIATEGVNESRTLFVAMVNDMLEAAVEVGELPASASNPLVHELLWDYFLGVVAYWIKDHSEKFTNTTQLVDKTVRLAESILKTAILDHAVDLLTFLFRTHIIRRFETVADIVRENPIKRAFFDKEKSAAKPKAKRKTTRAKKSETGTKKSE